MHVLFKHQQLDKRIGEYHIRETWNYAKGKYDYTQGGHYVAE